MSRIPRRVRLAVVARAGACCEYCRLHSRGQVGRFPVDHILPRSRGGRTVLANLALACPHCNARKWAFTDMTDPITGDAAPLFNPRSQIWSDHFPLVQGQAVLPGGKNSMRPRYGGKVANESSGYGGHPAALLAELGIPLGVPS